MTILSIHKYRDGGTRLIETDKGNYWVSAKGTEVLKGDYFKENAYPVTDLVELNELLIQLIHPAEVYMDIKRIMR